MLELGGLIAAHAAAGLVSWMWSGIGLLVGAALAVAVLRHNTSKQQSRPRRSGTRGSPWRTTDQ
ncbi:hypothetical protein NOGI109294_11705 [Nocardiopsis gilva]|uniref:hypothetical protein n=1 Tax=Nocardiopsis gilva TaxID=280236 RepID=UPI001268F6B0|nr:hypothetical protein [Nocardiopsis gilva]